MAPFITLTPGEVIRAIRIVDEVLETDLPNLPRGDRMLLAVHVVDTLQANFLAERSLSAKPHVDDFKDI